MRAGTVPSAPSSCSQSPAFGQGGEQSSAVGCEVLLCGTAHLVIPGTCTVCKTCSLRAPLLISLELCYPGVGVNSRDSPVQPWCSRCAWIKPEHCQCCHLFPLRAPRALRNRISSDGFVYKSLAVLCSPKGQCRVLSSSPCSRAWLGLGLCTEQTGRRVAIEGTVSVTVCMENSCSTPSDVT